MSKLFAIAIPILPNKLEEWKKFIADLNGKWKKDFDASRKKLGIRERTFHQQTPMGDLVLVTLEGNDPEKAFQSFATSNDEFTKWFHACVKSTHGIDLNQPPPGPMPMLITDSGE